MREKVSNRGFALVFVLIIMVVLVTTGTIIMTLSVQNSSINNDVSNYMECYYVARSQILHSIDIMRTNVELIYEDYDDPASFFYTYNDLIIDRGIDPLSMETSYISSINVTVETVDENISQYRVEAISSIENISRTLQANIIIEWRDDISLEEMFKVISIGEV